MHRSGNERIITVPVTFDAANRKRDRSVLLRFTTNLEVSNEDFAVMDRFVADAGWLVFKANEVSIHDIPDVPADEATSNLTPLQEMRWLLRKQWERNSRDMTWPEYYSWRMAKACQGLRDQLQL